ncbi:hypothetical protein ACHWQZ_G017921 [Mnemiopsis leidyi]
MMLLKILILFQALCLMLVDNSGEQQLTLHSATQSTTLYYNGIGTSASNAFDGVTNGDFNQGYCTHTAAGDLNPWWRAQLQQKSAVSRVVVYPRTESRIYAIGGVMIYVDDQHCGTISYESGISFYTVQCSNKVGSTIKLSKSGEFLMLCEVKVFGYLPGLQLFRLGQVKLL